MLTRHGEPGPRSQAMMLDVNGAREQHGTTANMIFGVTQPAYAISDRRTP